MRSSPLILIILALNVVVFFLWSSPNFVSPEFMQRNFAVSWEALMEGRWWVLITAVFSHYLMIHLFFNMLVLSSFGPIIEEMFGKKFFIIFYLVAGVVSSFSHACVTAFFLNSPDLPAVGASGALAGVLLLFCLLFPKEKILLMAILPLPAIWAAIAFVGLDLWGLVAQAQGGGLPIGHGAHLGGSLCGLLAYFYLRKRERRRLRRIY